MSDNPLAGTFVARIAVQGVVLCCAALTAPLLAGSVIAAIATWIVGIDPVSALLIALIAVGAVIGIKQWRKRKALVIGQLAEDEQWRTMAS